MKDKSVSPVLMLDPARQRRLIDGLVSRVAASRSEHERLLREQNAQQQDIQRTLADQLASVKQNCQQDRQSTLKQWDLAQEQAIQAYESATINIREEMRRIHIKYRKRRSVEGEVISNKVDQRTFAVEHQYKAGKDQPKKQKDAEFAQLEGAIASGNADLEKARALTIRRLNRFLDVQFPKEGYAEFHEARPESVRDAVDQIGRLNRELKAATAAMQEGFASKVVDSFYLPAFVAVFILIWSIAVLLTQPENIIFWYIASVPAAGVVGFIIYLILLMPLKRMTRQLHPLTERIRHVCETSAAQGKKISAKVCQESEKEIAQRRKTHLSQAKQWKKEQFAELDQQIQTAQATEQTDLEVQLQRIDGQFRTGFEELQTTMRQRAETVASTIHQTLTATDSEAGRTLQQTLQQHQHTLESLSHRLNIGLRRGMSRIAAANDLVQCRFPTWQEVLSTPVAPQESLDFIPIGQLRLGNRLKHLFDDALGYRHRDDAPEEADILSAIEIPESMPLAIHRRRHSGVIIETPTEKLDDAVEIAHQILWRILSTAVPGRAKVTLIDANSRGQHFSPFMALADHDPSLIHHRVWTTADKITQRLAELTQHVEKVLQTALRDQFERIEDYNTVAGSLAEPYQVVAAVGLPEGLSRESYSHLMSLIQSGSRCGVFVILVIEQGRTWPPDMPEIKSDQLLRIVYQSDKSTGSPSSSGHARWACTTAGLSDLEFWPNPAPLQAVREPMIRRIGKASLEAARVVVGLQSLLPDQHIPDSGATGATDTGISITIGSQGAGRTRSLLLGEGVRQHVLIAGKTGSGKSTLLHSIITAGSAQYAPDQLQFYLLDFKKGVEFKIYADSNLPHARVIGIESEREFGRSVLQRLDQELTSRGEAFRNASVQELGEFRSKCPDVTMPRLMLIIDEFQELFTRDDSLAADCTGLLDRLVRQGRSFGIHVVLSSQSLAGSNSLPRATLGQMAVRVAMQCSESDAAMILADDNIAARLLSRPGEAIYNDASGLVEGNHPFQVAWLGPKEHESMLRQIATRDRRFVESLPAPIVFEGNRPSRFTTKLAHAALASVGPADKVAGLIGESVELGPPTTLRFQSDSGRNAVVVAPAKLRVGTVTTFVASALSHTPDLKIRLCDGSRADDGASIADWMLVCKLPAEIIRARDAESAIVDLSKLVATRVAAESGTEIVAPPPMSEQAFAGTFSLDDSQPESIPEPPPLAAPMVDDGSPILMIVDALDRLRDLRQSDTMDFSLEAASKISGAKAFQSVLRDGPSVGVFVLVTVPSAEVFSRWLPRPSQHDLELRLVGPINAGDSSLLIDSPAAADLSPATMILYDAADGRTTKFRICESPTIQDVGLLLGEAIAAPA